MRKKIISILIMVCMLVGIMPMTVMADAVEVSANNATYYDNGALKSINANFKWDQGGADGRLVLTTRYLDGQDGTGSHWEYGAFSDFGWVYDLHYDEFSDVLAHGTADATDKTQKSFDIIAYQNTDTSFSSGTTYNIPFVLDNTDVPMDKNGQYYIYLWVKYSGYYFPDNLICVINVNNGVLEYVSATTENGYRNEYDSGEFDVVESAIAYDVTITSAANMTKTNDSGEATQENLTSGMAPVVYTADDGYYFPEDYEVATVKGIMVKRLSDNQIQVYGTPSDDAEISLLAPTLISTPPSSNIGDADSIFNIAIPLENVFDCQRTPAYVSNVGDRQICYSFKYPYSAEDNTQIQNVVTDIVNNPSDYYYKFTKGNDGKIIQKLHKYSDSSYEYLMADDGTVQAYGERCFLLNTDGSHYGTFVSFKDKEYHRYGTNNCSSFTITDNDPEITDLYEKYIDHGCGETFIVAALNVDADDMEDMDNIGSTTTTPATITITFNANGGSGTMESRTTTEASLTLVLSNGFTRDGYTFVGWNTETDGSGTSYSNGEEVDFDESITLYAQWRRVASSSSDDDDDPEYKVVKSDDVKNGTIEVNKRWSKDGRKVTITVTPDEGYELDELIITDRKGNKIDYVDNGDGTYTFIMPESKVEVDATYKAIEEEEKTIILTIDDVVADVFGEKVVNDVAPVIRNDRTMLPIRFVAEALGATVGWDDEADKVTIAKDGKVIEIIIGSSIAYVNGETVELDSPAFIENDRTYLPVRFVAENLDATVEWNKDTYEVTIIPE